MNAIGGLEIKVRRIRAGLRQYQLAAQLGITQTKLSRIECGWLQPSPELLERIWKVFEEVAMAHGHAERRETDQ